MNTSLFIIILLLTLPISSKGKSEFDSTTIEAGSKLSIFSLFTSKTKSLPNDILTNEAAKLPSS